MKIWYQSMTAIGYDPLWDEYGKTIKEQCKRVLNPDTEVHLAGVPVMLDIDKYKSVLYYHTVQCLNNLLQAEKEGYDAVAIGCSYDVGLDEGREMLNIPVVGLAHTNLHMASMLGELFAVVTTEPHFAEKYRQMIIRYGLQAKHMPGPYILPTTEAELAVALKNPKPVADKFKAVARKAVADGASVILPVPPFVGQLFYKSGGLTNLDGALVLDPVSVLVKVAEMMVGLKKVGIEVSRTLQVYGSPGKELLKKSLEAYAPVFKINY